MNNVCQLNTELEANTHQCRSEYLSEKPVLMGNKSYI